MSRTTRGYLISIAGVAFLSTTGVLIGLLTGQYAMPPLLLAFWRDLFVSLALLPALFFLRRSLLRVERKHWRFFLLYGFTLSVFNAMWTLSVKLNGAAVATVLAYGSTGFTALLAWWLFREQLDLPKIAAVVLSLGGCVLVANAYDPAVWRTGPLALSMGLLSGLLYAIFTLFGKEAAHRGLSPWLTALVSFGVAAVFLLVYNQFSFLPGTAASAARAAGSVTRLLPDLPALGWFFLILLAAVPTVFGFGLYNLALNYLPASIVNLLATLEPPLTAVQAFFILAERLTLVQIGGGLLILAAVVILRWSEQRSSGGAEEVFA